MLFSIWERTDWKKKLNEVCNVTEVIITRKELILSLNCVDLPFLKLYKFVIFVVHISFKFFDPKYQR